MTQNNDIREILIDELKKDVIGPRQEEEIFWRSEGDVPTSRYLSGVLYPKQTALDENTNLSNTVEGGESEDEEEDPENQDVNPFAIKIGTQPSSLGITCCVSENTKIIDAEINFAIYERQERVLEQKRKTKQKDGEPPKEERTDVGWKRKAITSNLEIDTKTTKEHFDIKDDDDKILHVQIRYKINKKHDKYYVTVYLINTKPKGTDYTESDECIFQPEFKLKKSENSKDSDEKNIFISMEHYDDTSTKDPEEKEFDLLFRNKHFFAVGRNCSVEWDKDKKFLDSVSWVKTTFIPQYEIDVIQPRKADSEPLSTSLRLSTLKNVKEISEYEELLSPIVLEYEKWIEGLDKQHQGTETFENTINHQIENCRYAKERIMDGIRLVSTDPIAGKAFRFANEAMYDQMMYSRWAKENIKNDCKGIAGGPPFNQYEEEDPPRWYIFQIAFILLNLKSIVEPNSEDREIVDLLWFPTGGGKTEAYLGIIAFVLARKRLRKENDGVGVIMRYTYRLLTIQQFHRAAALMCACECIRKGNEEIWGKEPFLVGLFVGNDTTPNSLETAKKNLHRKVDKENPVQIINCPRCGTKLDDYNYHTKHADQAGGGDIRPKRMAIRCANQNCEFGDEAKEDSYLPVVFIDDDIISTLPSLLIGTVDKFARLAWDSKFAAIFGKVRQSCEQHGFHPAGANAAGYGSMKICKHAGSKEAKNRIINYEKPLPPPELIIQDELHLITGPLGTLVGLYETVIEDLCLNNGIKPKIIASTATIKNSVDQIKWIFGRTVSKIFPPQALDFGDTHFSEVIPSSKQHGRIHVGICSTSAGGQTADARIAGAILRKTRHILENKNNEFNYTTDEIDPYYTLISYYNTRRSAGSALRYYGDSVPYFMGTISSKFETDGAKNKNPLQVAELTGRLDASEIPEIFKQIEMGLSKEMCRCGESQRRQSEDNESICQTCKKQFKRPLDAVLCTNMLSVGVDIQRLSLMVINNQPKHTAEYIQASGRIGRSKDAPGLVVTSYRYTGARDLSIYENFKEFHSHYHRNVEPGTLTPFAPRARETALFGVLVALIRNHASIENECHAIANNKNGASMFKQNNPKLTDLFDKIKERLESRVDTVDPKEKEKTIADFEECKRKWLRIANKYSGKLKYKRNYYDIAPKVENIVFLLKTIGDVDPPGFVGQQIPVSMRQADGNVKVYYQLPEAEDE